MIEYEVLVIGGGAAGLTAAMVLLRARRSVLVVDAGSPRNAPSAHMHGFLSRDGMPPSELIAAGRAEVARYGGTLADDTVVRLEPGFVAQLAAGGEIRARKVLVATGLRDEVPDVPGIPERWGRDVLHCPYCHGYEVRDQPLGVLGGSAEAVQHALLISIKKANMSATTLTTRTTPVAPPSKHQLAVMIYGLMPQLHPIRRATYARGQR